MFHRTYTLFSPRACITISVFFLALCVGAGYARTHMLYQDVPSAPEASHTLRQSTERYSITTPSAQRVRPVAITPHLSTPWHAASEAPVAVGDTLYLPLFDGAVATALVDRISQPLPGTQTLRGRVEGYFYGYVLFSSTDGKTLGHIRLPEKNEEYSVIYNPRENTHYLYDYTGVERDELLPSPPLIPPPNVASYTPLSADDVAPLNTPVTIDVMIVYTPAARQWADSNGGGINNVIAQAMGFADLAHDNSGTLINKRLVHAAQVTYTESSAGSGTDLTHLTDPSSGQMDEIHGWRDHYGADLVALFSEVEDTGGLGWLLNDRNGSPAYGFSITRVQQAGWTYTHIHEMGHNMGAHHHKQQTTQPGPTVWNNWPGNIWSAGWRWIGTDNQRYCDLMTYEEGRFFPDGQTHTRVPYFSNPSVIYQGVATGHATDGNNARTLREVRNAVAAYRTGPPPTTPSIGFSPSSFTLSVGVGQNVPSTSFQVRNAGDGTLSYSLSDNASWITSITPTSGSSTGQNNTHTIAFNTAGLAAGTYNASITITSQDADNSPQTIPVSLTVAHTHTISGTVSGDTQSGVSMMLSGTAAATVTTDAQGNYTFSGLFAGTYLVTPLKSGYMFTPPNRSITLTNADSTGNDFTASSTHAQDWKTDRFRGRILWRQDPTRGTFVIRGTIPTDATSLDDYDGVSIPNLFVLQAGATPVEAPTGTLETRPNGRVVRGRIINRETRLRILTRMRLRNGEIHIRYRLVRGFNMHTALDISNTDERSWTPKNLDITLNLPGISSTDTYDIEYRTREDRVSRVRETR